MSYGARVVLDSISEAGDRLTTIEATFPRIVLAEFNTHRVFSRNSASSRAIPILKQLTRLEEDPYIPTYWGKNQSGMQAREELEGEARAQAIEVWMEAAEDAMRHAKRLLDLDVHKQITNRLLEPFMWHTVIVTATEWSNFFALRRDPDADPAIQGIANMMYDAMQASTPQLLKKGEWHLPLIQPDELEWATANLELAKKVSTGRCARTSYLTHNGSRDHDADIELYERLVSNGHMSPPEHVATPHYEEPSMNDFGEPSGYESLWSGNFRGWKQFRKTLPNESDFSLVRTP